jgi:hypothetical protein
MVLNLNSNVIQSLVRSSNNNNNNFTNKATGEFFQTPHRKSVLSAHNGSEGADSQLVERHNKKSSLSPSFHESSLQDRTNQALLSKNLPHHQSRMNHFSHVSSLNGPNSYQQRANPKSKSPTKQILIDSGLSLGLGLGGPASLNQHPVFGIQDMHA